MYPTDRKYTKDHEWLGVDGQTGTVGITDFAQKQLGDVVYVDLPEVGTTVTAGQTFGTIESVKAVSELYAPVSGEVTEGNAALADDPALINRDPEGDGWFFKLTLADESELQGLMDEPAYRDWVKTL
jgi:glycine cleavage system H protein